MLLEDFTDQLENIPEGNARAQMYGMLAYYNPAISFPESEFNHLKKLCQEKELTWRDPLPLYYLTLLSLKIQRGEDKAVDYALIENFIAQKVLPGSFIQLILEPLLEKNNTLSNDAICALLNHFENASRKQFAMPFVMSNEKVLRDIIKENWLRTLNLLNALNKLAINDAEYVQLYTRLIKVIAGENPINFNISEEYPHSIFGDNDLYDYYLEVIQIINKSRPEAVKEILYSPDNLLKNYRKNLLQYHEAKLTTYGQRLDSSEPIKDTIARLEALKSAQLSLEESKTYLNELADVWFKYVARPSTGYHNVSNVAFHFRQPLDLLVSFVESNHWESLGPFFFDKLIDEFKYFDNQFYPILEVLKILLLHDISPEKLKPSIDRLISIAVKINNIKGKNASSEIDKVLSEGMLGWGLEFIREYPEHVNLKKSNLKDMLKIDGLNEETAAGKDLFDNPPIFLLMLSFMQSDPSIKKDFIKNYNEFYHRFEKSNAHARQHEQHERHIRDFNLMMAEHQIALNRMFDILV